MAFRATQCPACKKDIQVPDDAEMAICMYCGQSILVKDAIHITVGPSITNLLGLARTADVAGNDAEAETYYNRVLELDPTISEAWIGKGKSAGWQSCAGPLVQCPGRSASAGPARSDSSDGQRML